MVAGRMRRPTRKHTYDKLIHFSESVNCDARITGAWAVHPANADAPPGAIESDCERYVLASLDSLSAVSLPLTRCSALLPPHTKPCSSRSTTRDTTCTDQHEVNPHAGRNGATPHTQWHMTTRARVPKHAVQQRTPAGSRSGAHFQEHQNSEAKRLAPITGRGRSVWPSGGNWPLRKVCSSTGVSQFSHSALGYVGTRGDNAGIRGIVLR